MDSSSPNQLVEHFFRHQYGKIVSILVAYFGLKNLEIAEDIVQETLVEAMNQWSIQSIPKNPEGWLMDVAKKKTINYLKRNQTYRNKVLTNLNNDYLFEPDKTGETDNTLRMIFACCNPNLPVTSQISLALKTLCGLSVVEIANALLTNKETITKRLYRAKQSFRSNKIPFQIPEQDELADRLENVHHTLYLLFNEGYYSSQKENIIRIDLCYEAIRLVKEIITCLPNSNESKALLSLMLLSAARFESRIDENGTLIILSEQNRKLWDRQLIAEGIDYLHQSTNQGNVSIYHLLAGIAAEHCLAKDFGSTNWKSILMQYQILEKLDDSPIIRFNKAIAKYYADDQDEALANLLLLENEPELQTNVHLLTSIAIFQSELGEIEQAISYFKKALKITSLEKEKALIKDKMSQLIS